MFIGIARFTLFLSEQPHSLKEKRSVVSKIREALKNRLQVSAAEVGLQDVWQRAALGVACVTSDKKVAEKMLDDVRRLIESYPQVEITEEERDVDAW
ncbi:MAG: DUF503 domain-containing protein [Vulcanimicrobiota bacterium]